MNSRYLGLALTLSVAFAVVACSDNDDKNPVGVSGSKGGSKAAGCNFTLNSKTWEFSQVLPGCGTLVKTLRPESSRWKDPNSRRRSTIRIGL